MIPATLLDNTKSNAEKRLFPLLNDNLDDGFTVFHSFDLLTQTKQGKFIDGEIDFLIFHVELGFLVLEVKGGSIAYDGTEGIWYQNNKPMKLSPFSQAEDSKYKLGGFLRKKLGHDPACGFGHAICFPNVYTELKGLPSGADTKICITGNQLQDINKTVINIMSLYKGNQDRILSFTEAKQIQDIIMPHCEYGISLQDRIGQAEHTIFQFTENQCRLLGFINQHRQALIQGCAGSGKTILAVKKARELALKGNQVLLLSYNVMIGEQLSDAVSDLQNISASNYHRFCMDRLKAENVLLEPVNESDFWQKRVPEAFADLIQRKPIKFDAIIVDEGQDFHAEYWVTITEMVKDTGFFYIFYDPDQNLYGVDLDFPIAKEPFNLGENCRNTLTIFNKLKGYSTKTMSQNPDAPGGESVVELVIKDAGIRRRQLGKTLHDLVINKGINEQNIVILGGHSLKHTCIGENPAVGNFRITETEEKGPNVIQYHTYMKFKGCESDVVILIDVNRSDKRWLNPQSLYTAISRAKHLLYILYSGDESS